MAELRQLFAAAVRIREAIFIVIIAWLFGEASSRSDMPALPFGLALWAFSRAFSLPSLMSDRRF